MLESVLRILESVLLLNDALVSVCCSSMLESVLLIDEALVSVLLLGRASASAAVPIGGSLPAAALIQASVGRVAELRTLLAL